jgi:hypothetical protein
VTITEEARHRLHTHLEEIMGERHAAALMEWAPDGPLASKADIDHLREVMATKEMALDLKATLERELRTHTVVLVGAMITIAGVTASAARMF